MATCKTQSILFLLLMHLINFASTKNVILKETKNFNLVPATDFSLINTKNFTLKSSNNTSKNWPTESVSKLSPGTSSLTQHSESEGNSENCVCSLKPQSRWKSTKIKRSPDPKCRKICDWTGVDDNTLPEDFQEFMKLNGMFILARGSRSFLLIFLDQLTFLGEFPQMDELRTKYNAEYNANTNQIRLNESKERPFFQEEYKAFIFGKLYGSNIDFYICPSEKRKIHLDSKNLKLSIGFCNERWYSMATRNKIPVGFSHQNQEEAINKVFSSMNDLGRFKTTIAHIFPPTPYYKALIAFPHASASTFQLIVKSGEYSSSQLIDEYNSIDVRKININRKPINPIEKLTPVDPLPKLLESTGLCDEDPDYASELQQLQKQDDEDRENSVDGEFFLDEETCDNQDPPSIRNEALAKSLPHYYFCHLLFRGSICKKSPFLPWILPSIPYVQRHLKPNFHNSPPRTKIRAFTWGIEKEIEGVKCFMKEHNIDESSVREIGNIISSTAQLVGRPDRLVTINSVEIPIEVKSPMSFADKGYLTAEEVVEKDPKNVYLRKKITETGYEIVIKEDSKFFWQIQAYLELLDTEFGYGIVYTPAFCFIQKIYRHPLLPHFVKRTENVLRTFLSMYFTRSSYIMRDLDRPKETHPRTLMNRQLEKVIEEFPDGIFMTELRPKLMAWARDKSNQHVDKFNLLDDYEMAAMIRSTVWYSWKKVENVKNFRVFRGANTADYLYSSPKFHDRILNNIVQFFYDGNTTPFGRIGEYVKELFTFLDADEELISLDSAVHASALQTSDRSHYYDALVSIAFKNTLECRPSVPPGKIQCTRALLKYKDEVYDVYPDIQSPVIKTLMGLTIPYLKSENERPKSKKEIYEYLLLAEHEGELQKFNNPAEPMYWNKKSSYNTYPTAVESLLSIDRYSQYITVATPLRKKPALYIATKKQDKP